MCGVFGFITKSKRGADPEDLRALALINEPRGRDAWGAAWIDAAGRLRYYKQPGPVSRYLPIFDAMAGAQAVIGHTRFATRGTHLENINNHPHPCDGGWLVHNGAVHDYDGLIARYGLMPSGDCDSELLAQYVEIDGGLRSCRLADAARVAASACVLLALWATPRPQLVAARIGNPLWAAHGKCGVYLSSVRDCLPKSAKEVRDRSTLDLVLRRDAKHHRLEIEVGQIPEAADATLFGGK